MEKQKNPLFVDISDLNLQENFDSALKKADRLFYLQYTRSFIREVEQARSKYNSEQRGGFLDLFKKKRGEENLFVLEYEGVQGVQSMGGHRSKMTKRIHQVYMKITGVDPRKQRGLNRVEENKVILATPFGGLEVAYLLIQLVKSYSSLIKTHQSKQLAIVYDNEIWKWVWHWTVVSHGLQQKEHYDIFNIFGTKNSFPGVVATKISVLWDYGENITDDKMRSLYYLHLLSYLLRVQDFILRKELETNAPEQYFQQKEMLDMILQHKIGNLDKFLKGQKALSPFEQKIVVAFHPFHSSRIKNTLQYFQTSRPFSHLAWQAKLLPDSFLYQLILSLNQDVKRKLLKGFVAISKQRSAITARESNIIKKIEAKITRKTANLKSPTRKEPFESLRKEPQSDNETYNSAYKKNEETTEEATRMEPLFNTTLSSREKIVLEKQMDNLIISTESPNIPEIIQYLEIPFLVEIIAHPGEAPRVNATSLMQILLLNNAEVFSLVYDFLKNTGQLFYSKEAGNWIWEQKSELILEKLSPMEKIMLLEVSKGLPPLDLGWCDILPLLRLKFGYSAELLKSFEEKTVQLLQKKITIGEKVIAIMEMIFFPEQQLRGILSTLAAKNILEREEIDKIAYCSKLSQYC